MKKLPIAKASRSLADYAVELDGEILVVTDGKRPVAALVPLSEVDRESLRLSRHPDFARLMKRSREEIAAGRFLSIDQMRKRVLPGSSGRKRAVPSANKRRRGCGARRAR
jgi:antitoxin (DNA-binding transcriptional repressor) of toxin-antitoxin stability system